MKNLIDREKIEEFIEELKKQGKKIVFTNGVFDILHVGHLTYLEEAKSFGDILIVGINSDSSVKVNKGDKRPINSEEDRAKMIIGLKPVDYAVIFDEKTPIEIIAKIKPNVHIKGGDYKKDDLPETSIVELNGGVVEILSFIDNKSTTGVIEKILEVYGSNDK
ncbi:MAG: D-glycero-beta-D-manno-heptose 1-phosphate adenylyltransferase [Sebaldella sp.]|nr:D-glycero-beta-D-manno-heptose 1-phosphate adenylyltransferase [Sebaldella sp.]